MLPIVSRTLLPLCGLLALASFSCNRFGGSVSVSSAAQTVNESAGTATVQLTLSDEAPLAVRVPYVLSGTATAADFTGGDGEVIIPPGSKTAAISFSLVQHPLPLPDRTLIVTLETPENATLGDVASQTITIQGPSLPGGGGGGAPTGPGAPTGGGGGGLTASISPPGAPACPPVAAVILSLDSGTAPANLDFTLAITPSSGVDGTDWSVQSPGAASVPTGSPSVSTVTILAGQSNVTINVAANCGTMSPGQQLSLQVTPPAGVTMTTNNTIVSF